MMKLIKFQCCVAILSLFVCSTSCSSDEPQDCIEAYNEAGQKMCILDHYPHLEVAGLGGFLPEGPIFMDIPGLNMSVVDNYWLDMPVYNVYDVDVPAEGGTFNFVLNRNQTIIFWGDDEVESLGSLPMPNIFMAPSFCVEGESLDVRKSTRVYSSFKPTKTTFGDTDIPEVTKRLPLATPGGFFTPGRNGFEAEFYANKSTEERVYVLSVETNVNYDPAEDAVINGNALSSFNIYIRCRQAAMN